MLECRFNQLHNKILFCSTRKLPDPAIEKDGHQGENSSSDNDKQHISHTLNTKPGDEPRIVCGGELEHLTSKMAESGKTLKDRLESLHTALGKELDLSSPVSKTLVQEIRNRTFSVESEIKRLENQLELLEETLNRGDVHEANDKRKRKISSEELKDKLEVLKQEKFELEEEKKEWLKEVKFLKCQLQYREEVKQLQASQNKPSESKLECENKELKQENGDLKRRLQTIREKLAEKAEREDDVLALTEVLDSENGGNFNTEKKLCQLRRERKMLLSTIMKLQNERKETDREGEMIDASTQCQVGIVSKNWLPEVKNNNYEELKKELEELRKETEELEDENRILDEENAKLIEEKRGQEDTINNLKRQLTDALDSSIDEIEQLNLLNQELEKRLDSAEKHNEKFLHVLEELKGENCCLLDSILDEIEKKDSLEEAVDLLSTEVEKIIQINKSRKYNLSEPKQLPAMENKHRLDNKGSLLNEMKSCKNLIEDQRYQIRKLQMERRDIEENYVKMKRELVIMRTKGRPVKNPTDSLDAGTRAKQERKVSESAMNIDIMETVDERSENVFEENETLRDDNESLRVEINYLRSRRKELEILARNLKDEKCVLEDEKACLLSSLFNQVERCETLEQQINQLNNLPQENKGPETPRNNLVENGENATVELYDTTDACVKTPDIEGSEKASMLMKDMDSNEEQLRNLRQFVQELENEKQNLRKSLNASQKNVHDLQRERSLLSDKVQRGSELGETLRQCLREAHDEKQDLTDNFEELTEEIITLENQKKTLESLLEERTTKLESLCDKSDDLEAENKELYQKLGNMEKQLRFLYNKLIVIVDSIDTESSEDENSNQIKTGGLQQENDISEVTECLKITLEKLTEEFQRMRKTLEATQKEHKQISSQLETALTEKSSLQNLVRETEEKRRQMKSFLTRLTDEKEVINEQLDEAKQQKKNLAEAVENVYQSKEALQNALDSSLLKQKQTAQALYEASNDNKALRDSLYRVAEERDTLKDGILTARNEVELLTESEIKYKDRARGLQEEVDKLDEENSELRDSLKKGQKERDEMKELVADLINERNELAEKIEDLMNWEQVLKANLAKAALENDEALAAESELRNAAEMLAEENLELRKHLQQFLDNYSGANDAEVPVVESPIYGCEQVELSEEIPSDVTALEKTENESYTKMHQNESLKRQLSDLSAQNLKLRVLLQTVTESNDKSDLQSSLKSKEDALEALPGNCERVCEELDVLKTSFEEAIVDKQEASEKLAKMSLEKDMLNAEFQQIIKESEKNKRNLEEEKDKFAKLQDENRVLHEKMKNAEEEIETTAAKLNSVDKGNDELESLLEEKESLRKQTQGLYSENQQLVSEVEKLTTENQDMDDEIDELSQEKEKLTRKLEIMTLAIDNLETKLSKIGSEYDSLKDRSEQEHRKLAESLKNIAIERDELEKKLEMGSEEVSKLQENLQQSNQSIVDLKAEFTEIENTKDELTKSCHELTALNKELEKQLENALQEKATLRETINELKTELQGTCESVEKERHNFAEMLHLNERNMGDFEDTQKRLISLEKDVEKERREKAELRQSCDKLKQDLDNKQSNFKDYIENQSKEKLLMKEELKAVKKELIEGKQELNDKKILLQCLSEEIAKLDAKETDIKERCSQMARTIQETRETERNLREKLDEEIKNKLDLQENFDRTVHELNNANKEIECLKVEAVNLNIEEQELKSRVQNLEETLLETKQDLNKSLKSESSLSLKIGEQDVLRKKYEVELSNEVRDLKLSLCKVQEEMEAVKIERDLLQKDEKKRQSEVESGIREISRLHNSLEESDKNLRSAIEARDTIKQELEVSKEEKDEIFQKGSKLVGELKKEAMDAQTDLHQTRDQVDQLNKSLHCAQDEINSFRESITESESQKEMLEESLETLKGDICELQLNYDKTRQREFALIKELESKKKQDEKDSVSLKEKIRELQVQYEKMSHETLECEKKLEEEQNKICSLECSVERLKKENNTLKRWVDNKAEEKQRLDKSLKENEDQRRKLDNLNKELDERLKLVHNDKRITEDLLKKEKESSANLLYRLEEANEDKEELEEILEGLQTKKKKLQEEFDRAILEKEVWEEQLTVLKETLNDKVADLTEQEGNLKKRLEISEVERNALKKQVKEREQRLTEVQIQIQVLKSELADTKQRMEVLQKELECQTVSKKKDEEELRDIKEKLDEREKLSAETRTKIQTISDELDDSRSEITALRTKLKELRSSKGKLEKDAAEKEQTLTSELSYLRSRENTLLKTLRERDKAIETLKDDISANKRRGDELREQSKEHEIRNRNISEDLKSVLRLKQQLEKDLEKLRETHELQAKENENTSKNVEFLNKQLEESSDNIKTLHIQIAKLCQQNEQLRETSTLKEEILVAENVVVTHVEIPEMAPIPKHELGEKPMLSTKEESAFRSRTLSNAQKEISELELYIHELQNDLKKVREELFDLQHEVTDKDRELKQKERLHRQEKKRFQDNINELEEEYTKLRKQLSSFLAYDKNRSSFSTVKELKETLRKAESEMLDAIWKTSELLKRTKDGVGDLKSKPKVFHGEHEKVREAVDKMNEEKKQFQSNLEETLKENECLLKKLKRVEDSKSNLREIIDYLILEMDKLRLLIDMKSAPNELKNVPLRKSAFPNEQIANEEASHNTADPAAIDTVSIEQLRQSFDKLQQKMKLLERSLTEERVEGRGSVTDSTKSNKLQAENEYFAKRVNTLEKDKISKDRELVNIKTENQKLHKRLQSENTKLENLEKALKQSENVQKSLRESLNEMRQETQRLEEERQISKEELENMRTQLMNEATLEGEDIVDNFDNLAIMRREKNELTCAKAALEMKYKLLETKLRDKEDVVKLKHQDLFELQARCKTLENSLNETVEEKNKLVTDTYAFKIKLENENKDLASRMTKKDERVAELQKKHDSLMRHNQKLGDQVKDIRCERDDLGKKLCEAETEKERLEIMNEEYKSKIHNLHTKRAEYEMSSSYLAEQKEESAKEVRELKSDLESSRETAKELKRKVENLKQLLNDRTAEENKINHKKEKLLKNLEDVNKNLEEEVLHKEELASSARVKEQEMQDKIASLSADVRISVEEQTKMQAVINRIPELKKEYNQLEDENNNLIESLSKVQEQNIALKKENILLRRACMQLRGKKLSEEKITLNQAENTLGSALPFPISDLPIKKCLDKSPAGSSKSSFGEMSLDSMGQQRKPPPHAERSSPEGSELPDASNEKIFNLQTPLHSVSNPKPDSDSSADADTGLMIRVASFVNSFDDEEETTGSAAKKSGKVQKSSIKLQTCVKKGRRRTQEILSTDLMLANEQVSRRATQEIVTRGSADSDQRRLSDDSKSGRSSLPGFTDKDSTAARRSSSEGTGTGKPICTTNYCSPILSLVDTCPLHRVPSTERRKEQCPICKKDSKTGTRPKQFVTLEKYV